MKRLYFSLTIVWLLIGCEPKPEVLTITATPIAANILTTQTEEAVTETPTPLPTNRPTLTPRSTFTPTPLATPTSLPTETLPPEATPTQTILDQLAGSVFILTLEDMGSEFITDLSGGPYWYFYEELLFHNSQFQRIFGFADSNVNVYLGMSAVLDDPATKFRFDVMLSEPEAFWASFALGESKELVENVALTPLPLPEELGEVAVGVGGEKPINGDIVEVVIFRRGVIGAVIVTNKQAGKELALSTEEVAQLLDAKIAAATSGATDE